jgi:hypothetical protein
MDLSLSLFIKKYMPADKTEFSRDAVELLLQLAWTEAKRQAASEAKAREWDDKYGDL